MTTNHQYPDQQLFGTDGIRGPFGIFPVSQYGAQLIAKALYDLYCCGGFFAKQSKPNYPSLCMVIAYDSRFSSPLLVASLIDTFNSYKNSKILNLGMVTTCECAMITQASQAQFGIMVSASHNSYKDNGFKLFDDRGSKFDHNHEITLSKLVISLYKRDKKITQHTDKQYFDHKTLDNINIDFAPNHIKSKYTQYCHGLFNYFIKNNINTFKLKILIDCANGACSQRASTILSSYFLNSNSIEFVFINNHPDGYNINNNCGSNHPEIIKKAVLYHQADLAISFDGDGDRLVCVASDGKIISSDVIFTALAIWFKKIGLLQKNTAVTTIMTNGAIDRYLYDHHQIKLIKTDVGDKYIAKEITSKHLSFGGESSGHYLFCFDQYQKIKDHHLNHLPDLSFGSCGDGIIGAIMIIGYYLSNDDLRSTNNWNNHLSQLKLFNQINHCVKVSHKPNLDLMPNLQIKLGNFKKLLKDQNPISNNRSDNNRIIWRYSGTENKLRITVEGAHNIDFLLKYSSSAWIN